MRREDIMTRPIVKIQDYGLIGDGRSAALVSREGPIDWLCWPRFDSPSLFGNLLDSEIGGAWSIAPTQPAKVERNYVPQTNVLQTRFHTAAGTAVLTDFMPVASEEEKRQLLWPEHELARQLKCERGEVEVCIHFNPRPGYGLANVHMRDAGALGIRLEIGARLTTLRSEVKLAPDVQGGLSARVKLSAGKTLWFSLSESREGPAVLPPLGDPLAEKLAVTIDWWQRWASRTSYHGPYREQVVRSALVLKLMIYAPSGA